MAALPRILLVDDDAAIHQAVEFRLRGSADLTACSSADGALKKVRTNKFDVALVDVNLGTGISGIKLISCLHEADPDLSAIIFTAYSDYETAVSSLGAHSFDFIPKSLRDDRVFCTKIREAVLRTQEQRDRSRSTADAARLRSALADAVINNELEVTNSDIQRGFLSESLHSFSALLGQVELMHLRLNKCRSRFQGLDDVTKLSEETVGELQDYVGKLRDYFAEPDRAVRSVNEVLMQAIRIVEHDAPELLLDRRIERGELNPDPMVEADGRALLRAVVILLRMLLKAAPAKAALTLKPSLLFKPLVELNALQMREHTRILNTPNFRKNDATAVSIEVSGPSVEKGDDPPFMRLETADRTLSGASPWSAVAMVAKLNGALVVESKPGGIICYRIILKV